MRELKTLKDLMCEGIWINDKEIYPNIDYNDLRVEAIKWAKHYEEFDGEVPFGIKMWIMYFFDIEGGDLK